MDGWRVLPHSRCASARRARRALARRRNSSAICASLFSRAGSLQRTGTTRFPRGVALEVPLVPAVWESFQGLGAEEMAFNSGGACPVCSRASSASSTAPPSCPTSP